QLIEELAKLIEQAVRPATVVGGTRAPIGDHYPVAVMQADGVIEQRDMRLTGSQAALPPALQDSQVTGDRRAIEADQRAGKVGIGQRRLRHALVDDIAQEAIEM